MSLKKVFHGQKIVGSSWSFEILHTPGHTDDHICLAWQGKQVIFSGDHVMGWSSTMINYPSGNMINYFKSLKLLLTRSETLFFPGHGKPIKDALNFTSWQLNHKLDREKQIFTLICNSPKDAKSLVSIIYNGLDKNLHSAAESNIYAHLMALVEKEKIVADEAATPNSKFSIKFCKK